MILIFTEFVLWWKFVLFAVFLHKSYREKSCSWDIGQNALRQSDFRIFKSYLSGKNWGNRLIFGMLIQIHKKQMLIDIFWFCMVRNRCGQSGLWTLQNWWYLKNMRMELTDILHASTNSCKLKGDWAFLGWSWSEIGVDGLIIGL